MKIRELISQTPKMLIGFSITLGYRLIPVRIPNVEPIMATTMPFAKHFGVMTGILFPLLSVIIYDLATGTLGQWTIFTAGSYTTIGLAAGLFFKKRKANRINFVGFAIASTLFYDALTGLAVGPLMFGQSFYEAFVGQIPFTVYHLVSNVIFAAIFSPIIYKWILKNNRLEFRTGKLLASS